MLEQKYRLHKSTTCTTQVAISRSRYRKLHILFRKFQSTHNNTYVRLHPLPIYISRNLPIAPYVTAITWRHNLYELCKWMVLVQVHIACTSSI